jgi:hypothetical protein
MGASSRFLEPIDTPLAVEDIIEAYESSLYRIGVMNENGENVYPIDIESPAEPNLILTMSDGTRFKVTIEEV